MPESLEPITIEELAITHQLIMHLASEMTKQGMDDAEAIRTAEWRLMVLGYRAAVKTTSAGIVDDIEKFLEDK